MNVKELMDRLIALYPKQFATQQTLDAWGQQYRAVLGHLEPQELRAAFDATMSQHAYQRAPLPAEFAKHIPEKHYTEQATMKPPGESWADQVMQLREGQDALREGYGRELYLWAEKNPGTVPGAIVMDNCRRAEQHFRETFARLIDRAKAYSPPVSDGNFGRLSLAAALTAASNMDGFENQLRKKFLVHDAADEFAALTPLDAG